ncbi:MAG: ATP-binding cassette domain-containing protein [Clostridia bacterium]
MLKINNLSKSFHHHLVLDDCCLEIEKGDLIYIHGINGSGKSTLFKLICHILEADQGTIDMSDDVHIGALIENPGFLENETLQYNLKFLASLKDHYDKEKIEKLCQQFQLDFHSRMKLKNYSLGMRQKAGIIQAIMEDQNFILLDEPTRGLDQESIQIFIQLINEYHQQGKTIIIAAHDYLQDIHYNKTYQLENGKLQQDETYQGSSSL